MRSFVRQIAPILLAVTIGACNRHDGARDTLGARATMQHAPTGDSLWTPPDTATIPHTDTGDLVRYGRALIVRTAQYLGPRGTVARQTNGMNCENCHLDGGTRPYGNTFIRVASTYPKFRARRGAQESIESRVNDCITRSLNGTALDTTSREMRAMVAYMNWLGRSARTVLPIAYASMEALPYLDRAADPVRGRTVFVAKCQLCHGADGAGKLDSTGVAYVYPPLWGAHSYNDGAGMYRLSQFAGFVKNNMPYGVTHAAPQLSDDEAWDVAAFVNSQPRASIDMHADWPQIASKPVDYPFGPYADSFSEAQHKYGPFGPIAAARHMIH